MSTVAPTCQKHHTNLLTSTVSVCYMMTGGVSKNQGLVKTLEEKLGTTLVISDKAQLCGALGAALFAKDMVTE